MNDDDKLRDAFAKLREDDARRAPPFDELVRRGRPKRSPWAVVVPLTSAAAAAAIFLVWCSTQGMSEKTPTAAAPRLVDAPAVQVGAGVPAQPSPDREPLGFLLTLPGAAAMTAPDLDTRFLRGESR
jgi:hypothetical protein